MKQLVPLALAAALAACTTSGADLRSRPVVAVYPSHRAPADIAACLAESVQMIGAPSVYRSGADTVVSFRQAMATTALFIIAPDGTTSVHRVNRLVPHRAAAARCIQ